MYTRQSNENRWKIKKKTKKLNKPLRKRMNENIKEGLLIVLMEGKYVRKLTL